MPMKLDESTSATPTRSFAVMTRDKVVAIVMRRWNNIFKCGPHEEPVKPDWASEAERRHKVRLYYWCYKGKDTACIYNPLMGRYTYVVLPQPTFYQAVNKAVGGYVVTTPTTIL